MQVKKKIKKKIKKKVKRKASRFEIPSSPALTHMQVSKLNLFAECHRKYYWRFIRNVDPKKISIPFFVGGMYHTGLEAFYKGEDTDKIIKSIDTDIDDFLSTRFIQPEELGQLEIQRAIIIGMLKGYFKVYAKDIKKWKIIATELFVEMPIEGFDFPLIGTIDLVYQYKKKIWIGEHKTASQITKDYIDRLPFDLQVMLYPLMVRYALKRDVQAVCYSITRKPTIRQKQNETFKDFISRISDDYVNREDFYFYREEILYNPKYIKHAINDLHRISEELESYHTMMEKNEVLKMENWYRNSRACFQFGRCPFFNLCKHGDRSDQMMMFQKREPSPSEQAYLEKKNGKS